MKFASPLHRWVYIVLLVGLVLSMTLLLACQRLSSRIYSNKNVDYVADIPIYLNNRDFIAGDQMLQPLAINQSPVDPLHFFLTGQLASRRKPSLYSTSEHEDRLKTLLAIYHVVNQVPVIFSLIQKYGWQGVVPQNTVDQLGAVALGPDGLALETRF